MKEIRRILVLFGFFAMSLLLTTCKVDYDDKPVIHDKGEGEIGKAGGAVVDNAGNSVRIDPGTLSGLYIKIDSKSGVKLPDEPEAKCIRFEPAGHQFIEPVEIGLSYSHFGDPDPSSVVVVHYNPEDEVITQLPTIDYNEEYKIIYAETDHFSYFAASLRGRTFDTITDTRDDRVYKIITIGDQTWMAENLAFASSNSQIYDDSSENDSIYGRLYVHDEAKMACPDGWHLPTDDEWRTLEAAIGMSAEDIETDWDRGDGIGSKLKEIGTIHWSSPNSGASDAYGFSALPGGFGSGDGNVSFLKLGERAYFWTATKEGNFNEAWYRALMYDRTTIQASTASVDGLYKSVRCVKD